MLANLFQLLAASPAVTALVGTNPVRIYRHGSAPQGVERPYITQTTISQIPENDLVGPAAADGARVQLSCWSDDSAQVDVLARAARRAVEGRHDILDVRDVGRDPTTMRYRIDLDVQVWVHRPNN